MAVTQFSITMDNVPGSLADISNRLGYAGINIRGISLIKSSKKKSLLHLVVNDPVGAERIFREGAIEYEEGRVLAIELPNVPGALSECAKAMGDGKVNIEYLFPFISRTPNAIVILMTDNIDRTEEILEQTNIRMLTEEELYRLS
ncbi:MAG: hypothetical protein K8T10_06735 [Candidatus Eremiobacteraeota bacterium]|nr:hypothetical protein [Candidatus Eremiobacteraeota bacterium]